MAPAALSPEKVTEEKVTPEKTTRPPKDVAVPQGEQREPDSKTSRGRIGTWMQKGKSAVKNLRDRSKRGSSEEEDDQQEDSEKQIG